MKAQKVYILLVLCVLFWSGNFVLGRFIKADIEPIELAFFRWFFVFLLILPTLYFFNIKKLLIVFRNNIIIMLTLSLLGITLFNTILYFALQTTTATNALLINSITPIVILVFAHFILKTNISKIQVFGVVLSTVGVIYLVLKGDFSNVLSLEFQEGDFLILLSASTWALYSVLVKFKPKELNYIELFVSLVIIGFILLLPLYFYQDYSINHQITLVKEYWYFFMYVSIFTSILSYYFWHIGIDTIGADKTGQFTHLMPIFGSILAFIFLGETLKIYHIIGALLIAFGIYLSLFLTKKKSE